MPFTNDLIKWKHIKKGFSCEITSSQFCKSLYSRMPCWFPLYTERFNKMSSYFYLVYTTIPNYNWVTIITQSPLSVNFNSLCAVKVQYEIQVLFVVVVVSLHNAWKKTKRRGKAYSVAQPLYYQNQLRKVWCWFILTFSINIDTKRYYTCPIPLIMLCTLGITLAILW